MRYILALISAENEPEVVGVFSSNVLNYRDGLLETCGTLTLCFANDLIAFSFMDSRSSAIRWNVGYLIDLESIVPSHSIS